MLSNQPSPQKIWRYMDIYKLFDLISNKKLHFCRLDKLEDIYEGKPANKYIQNKIENFRKKTGINLSAEEVANW
ncbi:MAG: hypothetical protein ACD_60C00094G0004 [uncultured bacterium]|nr:MAG: hypothetical protein ACD_60C00094G0004 [uncultured bacterium]